MALKKIVVILLALILVGCGQESMTEKADTLENPNRFRIESGGNMVGLALVTDRETGIQYLVNIAHGGVVMLVDQDGNPYIANGWRDNGE